MTPERPSRPDRELFGDHYPAMSVGGVAGLLDRAKVEIEATAALPA